MHLGYLFVVYFTFIVLISSIFVYYFNQKIGFFVPLSFMIIALTYYFFGLVFGSFKYVEYIFVVYAIIGIIYLIKCIKNNKTSLLLTYGLLFLFIISAYFFIYCFKYRLSSFDEYYSWSPMVRTMFINNKFYSACTGGGVHIEYPPFFSLLELFFCKIYGSFSESVASIALHISSFSFFVVPYIDTFNLNLKKSIYLNLFALLIVILFNNNFRSILIDIPLAFIASFPGILVISGFINRKFGVLYYSISLACLLLTKQMGIGFYVFNLMLYIFQTYKNTEKKKFFIRLLVIVFVSTSIYYSWMNYIYRLGVGSAGQFSIFNMLSKLFSLNFNTVQIGAIKNIIRTIFIGDMAKGKLFLTCFIFYIIIFVLYYTLAKINNIDNKKYIFFNLIIIIIYYIFISFVYCFGMEEQEMLSLNSFFRYASTFNIYLTFLFILLNRTLISSIFEIIIMLIMLLVNISNYDLLIPKVFIKRTIDDEPSQSLIDSSNYINTLLHNEDRVLLISDYYFLEFKLDYLTMYSRHISSSKLFNENCINFDTLNDGSLIDEINKYDYVIFSFNNSDTFYQMDSFFQKHNDNKSILNDVLYKVLRGDETKMFHMMP